MHWIPFNCKTHFSLLKAFSKCNKLAQRCKEYGYPACVIADTESLSGAMDFHNSCRQHGIKPIIGCDFGAYLLIAKNKDGWFDLIKIVSQGGLDTFKDAARRGNLICITSGPQNGHQKLFGSNHFSYPYSDRGVYYVTKDEAEAHRILLCSGMRTTLPKIRSRLASGESVDNQKFFESDDFHLPEPQEVPDNEETIQLLNTISDMCDDYEIASKPMLPKFVCPGGMDEDEYLTQLCRDGWKRRLISSEKISNEDKKEIYLQRIKKELDVIFKADLSGYFLIVQDIINGVKERGWLAGPGRGSAAGCLVSYLIGITEVDPIEYDLIFERFYNEGRNTDDYTSLPDIDMDIPSEHRDEVIDYIKEKYGQDKVGQMITFGRLQGRAALKEVLRINDAVSFMEMNTITDSIPDEAKISDQLELMEDKSIIRWTLENEPDDLKNWCIMDDDGNLSGSLAHLFEQAIKIEGTNKSQGKHPAGVIISKHRLVDACPMTVDKLGDPIVAFEMTALEAQGHVKFDVLGIDLLSKIMDISNEN
jgi:DNA polymerase-3 subunit alpha